MGTTSSQSARTAYGWLIRERLGTEHTQIAQGGACLVAAADGCVGLERQFTKLNPNAATPDWDFSRYQANAVVINLGTNDVGHAVSSAQFQTAYTSLLRKVRAAYPQAWIFALETFHGRYVPQTQAAVKAAIDGDDSRVSFVDTSGWLGSGDLTDSVHPNDQGHRVIAGRCRSSRSTGHLACREREGRIGREAPAGLLPGVLGQRHLAPVLGTDQVGGKLASHCGSPTRAGSERLSDPKIIRSRTPPGSPARLRPRAGLPSRAARSATDPGRDPGPHPTDAEGGR
ncbi:GDSL-type esterase/lipase family protein [Streptomyces sp. NPDC020597]|uniref:GDSL-type esterase/lipase family protein n=1 Tax=Streptomyces sp. NPDC020597 TaxID=3365080 RepID=UPI0037A76795